MRSQTCLSVAVWSLSFLAATALRAQEMPPTPEPTPQHLLLKQFAGHWESEATANMGGGNEPMVIQGTESGRLLGGFWLVLEGKSEMAGEPNSSQMTLGYDRTKKKYVGTFVCTGMDHLWTYEGEFDAGGKKLTLHTVGPDLLNPEKTAKYTETLELVDADRKVFTSYIEQADGKLQEIVTVKYVRRK